MNLLRQCVRFREMLASFTRRELRQRYVGSVLGWPWPFIQPLLALGVYYLVFNVMLDLRLPEAWAREIAQRLGVAQDAPQVGAFQVILLCCGLVPWLVTAEFLVRSANAVLESGNLVKKVAFPSELLPVSLLVSYVINMLLLFAVFLAATWIFTPFFSPLVWLFPVVVILHALMLLGLAYLFATVNVFIRDLGQILPILVNLWFFLTPIVYVREVLVDYSDGMARPKPWIWVFDVNPMAWLVDLYRWTLVFPDEIRYTVQAEGWEKITLGDVLGTLGLFALFAAGVFLLGYRTFMANKHRFADEI